MSNIREGILEIGGTIIEDLIKVKNCVEHFEWFNELFQRFTEFTKSELFLYGNQTFGGYILSQIFKYLNEIWGLTQFPKRLKKKYNRILLRCLIDKFRLLIDYLPASYQLSPYDLESLPLTHPRHQALSSITITHQTDLPKYTSQLKKFLIKYNTIKVVFFETCKYSPSLFRDCLTGLMIPYYLAHDKKREVLSALYNLEGKIDSMQLLWHLTESKLSKKFFPILFQSIAFNSFIYVPKLAPLITESVPVPENFKDSYFLQPENSTVPIRVLCKEKILLTPTSTKWTRLVIHVHGGGFIGQTSFTHQSYLRTWANEIECPIFSIDYRLAPQFKFPAGIDDAWQAYTWLVKNSERVFGIVPEKVVLVGDSAGGNYITGLALKAKEVGFRQPDSLLLIYPAMNMQANYFSSGAVFSLEDPLLTYGSFFEICKHYVDNPKDLDSYLVSPVLCPTSLLASFPKTKIMLTWQDPLRSDTLRFADRLLLSNCDVQIFKYPDYVHGALNLATPNSIPLLQHFVQDALSILKSLIL